MKSSELRMCRLCEYLDVHEVGEDWTSRTRMCHEYIDSADGELDYAPSECQSFELCDSMKELIIGVGVGENKNTCYIGFTRKG
ncbi:MAG: hypothetical protein ACRCZ0_04500 [Cetobacterium sp.]